MKRIQFKLSKKKWIISIVILSPVILIIFSFTFGKILLAIKRAEFRKAGIPTTIQEYNDKYYAPIPESENALNLLKEIFSLYRSKRGISFSISRLPVLDQKIDSRSLKLYQNLMTDNLFMEKTLSELKRYTKVRSKSKHHEWDMKMNFFYELLIYCGAKIELAIYHKQFKQIPEIIKTSFLLNTLNRQRSCENYGSSRDLNYSFIVNKLIRSLSVMIFPKNDLKSIIKIIDKHEKMITENATKIYFQRNVFCFEMTKLNKLSVYYRFERMKSSFFYDRKNLLTFCSYQSGLNSYDVIKALAINAKQQELFLQPYNKIEPKLKALINEDMYLLYPMISIAGTIAETSFIIGKYKAIVMLRCAKTACAVELFRLKYKKLPNSLKQLVPEFLASVPIDIFNNKELKYKKGDFKTIFYIPQFSEEGHSLFPSKVIPRKRYGYYVYSVGGNLHDDNGDLLNNISDISTLVAVKK